MSDHQITITTRDDHELSFTCADGHDVISAGEAAGIQLPSLCRDGGCGACIGNCKDGDYVLGQYNSAVLDEHAKSKGDVLLCRTYPKTDLKIQAPYDHAHIHIGKHGPREASINELEKIADRTFKLKLSWLNENEGKAVEFEPGECMELEIPDSGIRRAYSLANTANWHGQLEFLIRLQPEGKFSTYLSQTAKVGDILNVYGPSGSFGFKNESFNPAIFIAGGTGLAPFLSILRRMAEWGEDRSIHLLFGVNQEKELFCVDELRNLQYQMPGFTFTVCIWKPEETLLEGFCGTPAEALNDYLTRQPDSYDIYLCGPPMLVTTATQTAFAHGIHEEQIYSEKFG